MNQKQIKAAVEAMLFAAGDPVSADKLAAAVQRHLGRAAGDAQDPVPQPPKAQHLGMAAGGGAAGPAQVHLRLVGGVLRHQKNLLAPVPQLRDAAEDRF